MLAHVALFAVGLVVLVIGAECLIRGAVQLATRLGISPFVVGLTVVGFGTSAPELVVTLSAVLNDKPALAVGNIVGSNIANIGLILGLAAVFRPIRGNMRLLTTELPIVLGVTLLFWFLVRDNVLSRADAGVLLFGFAAFTAYMFRTARRESAAVKAEVATEGKEVGPVPAWRGVSFVVLGLLGLVGGAEMMVRGAVEIARFLGASELMIGLTVVAVGTSLPEMASTVAAALRGQSDLALGNVIGSNIFNVLLILGITGMVCPLRLSDAILMQELPAMALFAALLFPCLANGLRVSRWEGAILLAAYLGFVAWQIKSAVK
jgi:cation:H+ antiporter